MRIIFCAIAILTFARGLEPGFEELGFEQPEADRQCLCPCPTMAPTPAPVPPDDYRCNSTGDPHLQSFYENHFDNMVSGEVVLWRNENVEIQTRQQTWKQGVSNNSGLALKGTWTCGYTIEFTRGELNGDSWQDTSTMRVTDSNGVITADRVAVSMMSNVIRDLDCSTLSMDGNLEKQTMSIHFVHGANGSKINFKDLENFTNVSVWTSSKSSNLDGDAGLCVELAVQLNCDTTFFTTYWDGADCNSVTPTVHVLAKSSNAVLDSCESNLRAAANEYCKICQNFDEDENQMFYNCVFDICIGGDVSYGIGVRSTCNSAFIGELPNSGCFPSNNCESGNACLEDGVCECAFTGNECVGCCVY